MASNKSRELQIQHNFRGRTTKITSLLISLIKGEVPPPKHNPKYATEFTWEQIYFLALPRDLVKHSV